VVFLSDNEACIRFYRVIFSVLFAQRVMTNDDNNIFIHHNMGSAHKNTYIIG